MAAKKKGSQSPLDKIVADLFAKQLATKSTDLKNLGLFEFLVAASPHYQAPHHLSPVVPHLLAMEDQPGIFAFSAPPRHGKSVLTNHYVAWRMLKNPGFKVAYGSYSLDLSAGFFSTEVKDILTANGVRVDRTQNSKQEWRLENGSSFKAVAPGSGFTGRGADLIVIDDPYKSQQTAESAAIRAEVWNWFTAVAFTRRSPNCSVLITHTRWMIEDLIGVLSRDHGVPYINLPAVTEEGALWPEQWSRDRLLSEVRPLVGEYVWSALYMGNPVPRGGAVFHDPTLYSDLDRQAVKIKRIVIGIDCAYTKKTHSDHSAAVVAGIDENNRLWIFEVMRVQEEAPVFAKKLKALRERYGNPTVFWYASGIEKGFTDFFLNHGVPVKAVNAKEDKFHRAQAVAAAWNAKNVLIPDSPSKWCSEFISEVLNFTGLDDIHDDQVDALAAAYIPLAGKKIRRGMGDKRLLPV